MSEEQGGGMERFRKAKAAKGSGGMGGNDVNFKVAKGQTEVVRFLDTGQELDKQWCYVHTMPPRGKQRWGDDVPCLDQAGDGAVRCPGCERGLDRSILGFVNLIWRNGPIYERDSEGRINWKNEKGRGDVLAVWIVGQTRLEEIDAVDSKYKGLTTRDWDITRNMGDSFDTRYRIDPHMDPESGSLDAQPMSEADMKLAEQKPDVKVYCQPPTFEAMLAQITGGGEQASGTNGATEGDLEKAFDQAADTSPFQRS